jgi:hypothetical protein
VIVGFAAPVLAAAAVWGYADGVIGGGHRNRVIAVRIGF